MSDTIQGKLLDIILGEKANDIEPLDSRQLRVKRAEPVVAQILQAVQDAGYAPYNSVHQYKRDGMVQLCMTGEEWYNRLAKHLNSYDWSQDEKDSILQAAFEVAEGLTDKEGA